MPRESQRLLHGVEKKSRSRGMLRPRGCPHGSLGSIKNVSLCRQAAGDTYARVPASQCNSLSHSRGQIAFARMGRLEASGPS